MDFIYKDKLIYHDASWQQQKIRKNRCIIPIYGQISCGYLKSIDDNVDGYIEIPKDMIGKGDYFVLRASGDSMINADIHNGDLIIIQRQTTADDGDIVAVMIDNDVTLKRFFRLDDIHAYELKPENPKYNATIVKDCDILGVATKKIESLK